MSLSVTFGHLSQVFSSSFLCYLFYTSEKKQIMFFSYKGDFEVYSSYGKPY